MTSEMGGEIWLSKVNALIDRYRTAHQDNRAALLPEILAALKALGVREGDALRYLGRSKK